MPVSVASLAAGLGVVSLVGAVSSLRGALGCLRQARLARSPAARGTGGERPEALLIVPCCGDEDGLRGNLEALLSQHYAPYRTRFVVARPDDAAVPVIEEALARFPGRAELVVAGLSTRRGQKVHGLLAALDEGALPEVLVFADSDGRVEPGWLEALTGALARPGTGVASSYRFYRPVPPCAATLLRSVWNLSVMALLGDHDRNFAWGGSMAIRREVFVSARVREAWLGALSDDYALTHAVRRAGLRVSFVPEALVGSEGAVSIRAVLAWTARQIGITRVYWPALFRLAAASSLSYAALLVLAPLAFSALPLALLGASLALGVTAGALRALALGELAPQWREELGPWLWAYALMAPLAGLVTALGVLRALRSRRIEWRGIRYEMRSPHETLVLGR